MIVKELIKKLLDMPMDSKIMIASKYYSGLYRESEKCEIVSESVYIE